MWILVGIPTVNGIPLTSTLEKICSLSDEPIQMLRMAAAAGGVDDEKDETNSLNLNGKDPNPSSSFYMYAKRCPCDPSYVCPVGSISSNACGYTEDHVFHRDEDYYNYTDDVTENGEFLYKLSETSSTLFCFHLDHETTFIRNAWPVVILWLGGLIIFLYTSDSGRNARLYFCNILFRHICCLSFRPILYLICCICHSRDPNEDIEDRIISRENEIRQRLRLQTIALFQANQRVEELEQTWRQNSGRSSIFDHHNRLNNYQLVVRTKAYRQTMAPRSDRLNEKDIEAFDSENSKVCSVTCSVCLDNVNEGDKVGDLSCGHVFHINCLKGVS